MKLVRYPGAILLLTVFLAACGSGGGGGGDETPPNVTAPDNIIVEATSPNGVPDTNPDIATFLEDSSAIDNEDPNPVLSTDAPSTFPLGNTLVTFTYTDASGNAGTGTATVSVVDTTAPVVTAPADIAIEAPGTTTVTTFLAAASVTDIADAAPTLTTDAPSAFPPGDTVVTFTYTDASGNSASDTATVSVTDTVAPVTTAPSDAVFEATGPSGIAKTDPAVAAYLASATVVEAGDPNPVLTDNAPASLPLGVTTVTYTYTDWAGNSSTDTSDITVVDTTSPSVTAPADIVVEATGATGTSAADGAIVAFLAASSETDAVDPTPVLSSDEPGTFPLGDTVVTFTYTDFSGNVGTDTATVTVVDTTAPVVTVPADINVEATGPTGVAATAPAIVAFLAGSSETDAVDASPVFTNDAPTTFPPGATVVTFTYSDASGNAGSNTATVNVVDTTAPVVTAPGDVNIEATSAAGTSATDAGIAAFLAGSSATDIADAAPVLTTDAPATFPLGDTIVTFTYTDASGNAAVDTATVTVEDTTPPVISLTGDDPFVIEQYSTFNDPGASVADIVDQSVTVNTSGSVNTSVVGTYPLTYTATDASGNAATPVARDVIVEEYSPRLDDIQLSEGNLDQAFQVNQLSYTASVFFDTTRIRITPSSSDIDTVEIKVDDVVTASGTASQWINLSEGNNNIDIVTKSSDGSTTRTYSLSIDRLSLSASLDKITATDGAAGDRYGHRLALSGDTLAVGAYLDDDQGTDSGSVYVYTRSGGVWSLQQKLTAADGVPDAGFGSSVALEGDILAVGAWKDDDNGALSGSVYIYERTGSVWGLQQKLTAGDGAGNDRYGYAVSLSGTTLAVGAFFDDDGAADTGSVYVYTFDGSVWSQQQKLTASDGVEVAAFGLEVSLEGDTVAVGAPFLPGSSFSDGGSVYVFIRNAGVWSEQANIPKPVAQLGNGVLFGQSVSLSGDSLAIGCPFCTPTPATFFNDNGVVFVYTRSGVTWSQEAAIEANALTRGNVNQFGDQVSISGDTVVVGNKAAPIDGTANTGYAYIFTREAGMWSGETRIFATDSQPAGRFGWSVLVEGSDIAIGAAQAEADNGAVYIFK